MSTEAAPRTIGGAVTAALWTLAYLLVCATGQSFSIAYLDFGWQIVPWTVLRDDPIGSVWYLHIQPPLWNLLIGGLAKLSPLSDAFTLRMLMFVLGAGAAWLLHNVLRAFGLRAVAASSLTLLVLLNPEVFQWVFGPTYEQAIVILLIAVVRTAQRTLQHRRGIELVWCSVAITALVLTRSLYHPLLIAVLLVGLWLVVRHSITWRSASIAALVPLVLVGGWMLKNEVLFGRATLSSWLGMNLQRSTIPIVPKADLDALHAAGEVTSVATIGPFGNYDLYRPVVPPCTPTRAHPALSTEFHIAADGSTIPNFNYECFLPLYDYARNDFLAVVKAHPDDWIEGRALSTRLTFATSVVPGESESVAMRALDTLYQLGRVDVTTHVNVESWGQPLVGLTQYDFRATLITPLLYIVLTAYALWMLIALVRRRSAGDPVVVGTVVITALLGFFTVFVGVVAELGEQARFRSVSDPIALAIGLVLALRLLRAWLAEPTPHE